MSARYRERPPSFQDALKVAREILSASNELVAKGSIDAESEQLVLAAYRAESGKLLSRMELYARVGDRYPDAAGDQLLTWAGARAEGKTLQHLTGFQVFLGNEYAVGPDVLVPRPETEVLVAAALDELRAPGRPAPNLGIEIGLGSGVISIELLAELDHLRMVGSELTAEAVTRTRANARQVLGAPGADRLEVVRATDPRHVWEPLASVLDGRRADFVISNPPYLTATDTIEDEVRRNEPATALFAPGEDPLYFYRAIVSGAERYLLPEGMAFVELAHERAIEVLQLFSTGGWNARLVTDLTGRNRVLVASLSRKS